MGRSVDTYCMYHRTDDNRTDNCWTLKQQIEQLIQRGHLIKFVKGSEREIAATENIRRRSRPGDKPSNRKGKIRKNAQERDEHETANKGLIGSIAERFSRGGSSSSSRKRYAHSVMSIRDSEIDLVVP